MTAALAMAGNLLNWANFRKPESEQIFLALNHSECILLLAISKVTQFCTNPQENLTHESIASLVSFGNSRLRRLRSLLGSLNQCVNAYTASTTVSLPWNCEIGLPGTRISRR
jgi:hypothetical protein